MVPVYFDVQFRSVLKWPFCWQFCLLQKSSLVCWVWLVGNKSVSCFNKNGRSGSTIRASLSAINKLKNLVVSVLINCDVLCTSSDTYHLKCQLGILNQQTKGHQKVDYFWRLVFVFVFTELSHYQNRKDWNFRASIYPLQQFSIGDLNSRKSIQLPVFIRSIHGAQLVHPIIYIMG